MAVARVRVALEAAAAVVAMARDGVTALAKAAEAARVTAEAAELAPVMKPGGQAAEARVVEENARVAVLAPGRAAEPIPTSLQTLQVTTDRLRGAAALELRTTRPNQLRSFEIFPRAARSPEAGVQFS